MVTIRIKSAAVFILANQRFRLRQSSSNSLEINRIIVCLCIIVGSEAQFRLTYMARAKPKSFVRPIIRRLHPYVPGEQPKIQKLIKLNTNENPYPPSPKVLAATRAAVNGRLRLYPNPTAQALREKLAQLHGCGSDNIIVGNGSDELLAMAVRCFVEPAIWGPRLGLTSLALVQFFTPGYSLYPVLAEMHGAKGNPVALNADFSLPAVSDLEANKGWNHKAALTFITTPNAPSGRGYGTSQLDELCRMHQGVVVLDEAYVDFASENALSLSLKHPHVLVARTFSKAYSLCFQRVGYMVGHPELIAALQKIRDSYNVNGLGQVAALATLNDLVYYQANFGKIIATRERLRRQLFELGFEVLPSQTNFILVRPPCFRAEQWLEKLRERRILVRWFGQSAVRRYLRITIGTPQEAETLVRAAKAIVASALRG
jgi:histidinol-phosphate aminotransferase